MADWTYPTQLGDAGIFEMGRRIALQLGRLPDATSFTHDPREMLRITRRVEEAARGGRLLTGFQTAPKFSVEAARYRDLVAAGTEVIAFGSGKPTETVDGLEYRELRADTRRLENQWFLVSDSPDPVAFVSWELGDPSQFGQGGAATPGKRFVGFVSDDKEVVTELIRTLTDIRGIVPDPEPVPEAPPPLDERANAIVAAVEATTPPDSGAPAGAVVVPVGRGDWESSLSLAMAIARAEQRPLVIVDRSGESLIGGPYDSVSADDDLRPRKDALFPAHIARRQGRAETGSALDAARSLGLDAGAWFPTASGAEGIRRAATQFDGALVVVSAAVENAGIGERIRGMTTSALGKLGLPVIFAPA